MSEHDTQKAFFQWARLRPLTNRAYAIPNGGARHIAVAAKLKAEGARKGVLDVCLPVPRAGIPGLYIEFKHGAGTLSPEQQLEAQALAADGFAVLVCWDAQTAIDQVSLYLRGSGRSGIQSFKPVRPRQLAKRKTAP